jgi:phosphate transport system substrate-binding protein
LDGSQQLDRMGVLAGVCDDQAGARARATLLLKPIRDAGRTIIILSLALASCRGPSVPVSPSPEIVSLRLLTDSATSPLLQDLISAYRRPGIQITWDVQTGEIGTLVEWLKSQDAPYALIDYVPDRGFDQALWSTPVGEDGIAIVVHPSNAIANLTAAQLRAIWQGRIANWNVLGGPSLPMTVVARDEDSSTATVIQAMALGDRRVTRAARLATTSQAVIDIVSAEAGAVGSVSMGYLSPRVRAVPLDGVLPTPETVTSGQYPLRTPILFVGLREPGNDPYRAFFAWAQSQEGQAIVRRRYGTLATQ